MREPPAAHGSADVCSPRPRPELSTERVLTMERLEKGRLTVQMRLLGGSADRRGALAVFNLSLLTLLAATAGVMAVLLLLVTGG